MAFKGLQGQGAKIPLRWLLMVPFVSQVCLTVGLTGWLSWNSGQQAIRAMTYRLMDQAAQATDESLDHYLSQPAHLNQQTLDAVKNGWLPLKDLDKATQYLWLQAKRHPDISYVNVTLLNGSYAGAGKWIPGEDIVVDMIRPDKPTETLSYRADTLGRRERFLLVDNFQPRSTRWFQLTTTTQQPTWVIESEDAAYEYIAASLNFPLYNEQGKLLGTVGADLNLRAISETLRQQRIGQSGKAFIIERNGNLVAHSLPEPPYRQTAQGARQIKAIDSPNATIRAVSQEIQRQWQGKIPQQAQRFVLRSAGEDQWVAVMPWKDSHGLSWAIVITVPESEFMGQVQANMRTTVLLCLVALGISVGVSWQISRWVSHPIVGTIQAAEALSRGNWRQAVPESISLELVGLSRAFNEMAQQLQGAFQKREYLATHDTLTGLLNPTAFREQLQERLTGFRQTGRSLAVLFLDLDDFKFVNDHLGHLLGDELLVAVTQRLQQCLRDTDALARFGGDEFVILLSPVESVTETVQVANRLLAVLQPVFPIRDHDIFVKASVGIVLSDRDSVDGDTPDSLLRQADIALYRAKSNGKARYECFDAAMQAEVSDRLALELELRQALDREEFEVYYQPIMTTDSGDVRGFEALVRWNSPTRGFVSPAQFIPLCEATGLILPLGEWVLTQACVQMQQWRQQFERFQSSDRWVMSVNLSGKQFAQVDVVDQVQRILAQTTLPAQALKLEITESLLVHNSQVSRAKLKAIRDLGVQLSLDDFGTGYSSLSYLHQFPFHTLKIDRSFINRLQCDDGVCEETDYAIVEAIIAMAHKLHMTVVAEGVETAEQWRLLQAMGCGQVQGYFFSRPKSAGDITALLEDRLLKPISAV